MRGTNECLHQDNAPPDGLREIYDTYFEIKHSVDSTEELLRAVYRLRYQVYCVEYGYENAEQLPDQQEKDEYDARSAHTSLIHRATGVTAGTVRIIRPDFRRPHHSLPIDSLCQDPVLHDERVFPRDKLVEVSRFAISKEFRKRADDIASPTGVGPNFRESGGGRRKLTHLSLGLFQGMLYNSRLWDVTSWVAEMEPALIRMLHKLGIHFHDLGPAVEFHGQRQPCYTHIDEMLDSLKVERPDVFGLITMGGVLMARRYPRQ